jgi:hypothetical protein
MDVLAYCRAMAAFCRQRGVFEGESDTFWSSEAAEWDKLISEYTSPRSQLRTRTSSPEEEHTIGDADRILSVAGALQVQSGTVAHLSLALEVFEPMQRSSGRNVGSRDLIGAGSAKPSPRVGEQSANQPSLRD